MEVCGTHTAAIFKSGVRSFLSPKIRLVSGPGCPVCVTVPSYIDRCIRICRQPGHELVCFGDLMKVPGTETSLSDAAANGGRVRMAYSPFDTALLAEKDPGTTFVFAAIGFETTAPAFALLLEDAAARGIRNLKLLTSLKSALSAMDWICAKGEAIDAFLCPGHVSVVTGADAYLPLSEKYGKPFVVAGFEDAHLLAAIDAAARDAAAGRAGVRNLYPEAVSAQGNPKARAFTENYFDVSDALWRGLGSVENSAYILKKDYLGFDADAVARGNGDGACLPAESDLPPGCRCGDVILGRIDPDACPLFGTACTPAHAMGPCMVSSEGACGVWRRGRM